MTPNDNEDVDRREVVADADSSGVRGYSGNDDPDIAPRSMILSMVVGSILGVAFWLGLTELLVRCT
jgi:hypothetical protein